MTLSFIVIISPYIESIFTPQLCFTIVVIFVPESRLKLVQEFPLNHVTSLRRGHSWL